MSDMAKNFGSEALLDRERFLNRVWQDVEFRARLESDPAEALREMGVLLPDDTEIRLAQDSETVINLHIPSPPYQGEVADEDLLGAQGGLAAPATGMANTVWCNSCPGFPQ